MCPLCSSLSRIDDINEFISAALRKEEILSYLGVFVTNSVPGGGFGRGFPTGGPKGKQELALEQGMITYLAPGEDVKTINPAGVSAYLRGDAADHPAAHRQRPGPLLRGGQPGYEPGQLFQRPPGAFRGPQDLWRLANSSTTCSPRCMRSGSAWMLLSGQLPVSPQEYAKNPEAYERHVWVRPGWDWIDPLKEANANRVALDTCQTTLQEICASKGKDWRDIIAKHKVEMEWGIWVVMGHRRIQPPDSILDAIRALKVPKRHPVSRWADENRILDSSVSSPAGPVENSYHPTCGRLWTHSPTPRWRRSWWSRPPRPAAPRRCST